MGWLREVLHLEEVGSRRYASFLETDRTDVLPGVCQRYVITDGLHDLVFGIPEWRHYKSEWMAGRKSAPLHAMKHADYQLLLQARKHFIKAREQMLMRDYYSPSAFDRLKLRKDPPKFFKTVTTPVGKEIQAGNQLMKRVVDKQKSSEFEDSVKDVDYAARRRQLLTLEGAQQLATNLQVMAQQCGARLQQA
ncbi:unnamed protein product [Effrenium voratum]|uniref:Uncharacterized protein n=1 Tax=Effrenium voratum TaxID=2562239 RepID=A0AA36JJN9_9DINO|nr:unnamed protein product [Effrenium voratum]CAJ1406276.1 unnamed protein product [Effrenium voratum]CAJ1429903.1 unnamed protein product [Effrenium voratum]